MTTTPEEYIELAEGILASAKAVADRGYDSPSIEAYSNRAAALSNIAHAYISLAQTVAINKAADAQVVTATKFSEQPTPNYGTPSAPVEDNTVSDAQVGAQITGFDIDISTDIPVSYNGAVALLNARFPDFSITEIDVDNCNITATLEF